MADEKAAYRRPCPRTLDRPILVFGLEPEDLVALGLVAGGLLFVTDPLIAVGVGLGGWAALLRLKAGRPPGYLFCLAYRLGLLALLPRCWRPPHLLPPSPPRRPVRLTAFPDPSETRDPVERDWWGS